MKKLNVLHIGNILSAGGGQLAIQNFVRYSNKNFFKPFVCGIERGGVRGDELKEEGYEVLYAGGDISLIKKFIKDNEIHIIHFHRRGRRERNHTSILKDSTDLVLIETNIFGEFDPETVHLFDIHLFKSIFALNERYLANLSKWKTRNFFNKYKVLYNPVDLNRLDKIKPNEKGIVRKKRELGIHVDDFVVGKIGSRPAIEKWSDLILDFIPYAKNLIPNLRIVIQGVPESRRRRAEKLGVIMLDEVYDYSDLALFYNLVDVLVHLTKRGENSGNAINEAMAYEKPVIVNSTPRKDNGQLEQVIHMKNGIVANYPQTVARALDYLYRNEEELVSMGRAARIKVEKEYEASKITRILEKVYVETASKKYPNLSKDLLNYASSIEYFPSEQEIADYRGVYKERCGLQFGGLALNERILNYIKVPNKMITKFRDVIDHKLKL